jgi:hypothetical protein
MRLALDEVVSYILNARICLTISVLVLVGAVAE